MSILLLAGSTRENSNSEQLAKIVLEGLSYETIIIRDLTILPFEDLRHTEEGFHPVDDDYTIVVDALLKSDTLVLATPIYWYSMSAILKQVIDRFSHAIRDERYPQLTEHLKTMKVLLIAVGGDHPTVKGLPLVQQCQYICDFLGMAFYDYILGEARKPGTILEDSVAMARAGQLNQKLKEAIL